MPLYSQSRRLLPKGGRSQQKAIPNPKSNRNPNLSSSRGAMAARGLTNLLKVFAADSFRLPLNSRAVTTLVSEHTAKWMQDTSKKSPMELINEVPPIKVEGRIVACEGDSNPALGHPIEFICLDLKEPAICKYCGLRYVQHEHH